MTVSPTEEVALESVADADLSGVRWRSLEEAVEDSSALVGCPDQTNLDFVGDI